MIRLQRKPGTFLPTFEQHHLLRAALLRDPAAARRSFDTWKSRVPIDDVDHGSLRLLPLLYRNLTRLGIDDPLLPRLKGVYRQVWFRNQLILDQGTRYLRTLAGAGIPAVVLKGAALVHTVYAEPGLRPMTDFDVLVPREHFRHAVELLLATGWSFDPPLADPEPHFLFQHAVGFAREGGGALDLHWSAMGLPLDDTAARTVFDNSQPLQIGAQVLRTLTPADQLLQICAHATLRNPDVPPIRWAADAALLLADAEFPWDTVLAHARARGLSHVMHRCLEYLRDGLDVAIPQSVLTTLAAHQRLRERVALTIRNTPGRTVYLQFFIEWMQHAFADTRNAPRRLLHLPRFLRSYCRVATTGALLRLLTSRLALNTRRNEIAP
jgi:hypothetical protein